MTTIHKQNCCV